MAIRKTGAVTGKVIGTEPQDGITRQASSAWTSEDDSGLDAENTKADTPGDG